MESADCRHRRTLAPAVEVSSQVIQRPRNPIKRCRPVGNGAERPETHRRARSPPPRVRCRKLRGITTRAIPSVVAISSALAGSFAKSLRKEGTVSAGDVRPRKHVQNLLLSDGGFDPC